VSVPVSVLEREDGTNEDDLPCSSHEYIANKLWEFQGPSEPVYLPYGFPCQPRIDPCVQTAPPGDWQLRNRGIHQDQSVIHIFRLPTLLAQVALHRINVSTASQVTCLYGS
jgi:hypothetical protein